MKVAGGGFCPASQELVDDEPMLPTAFDMASEIVARQIINAGLEPGPVLVLAEIEPSAYPWAWAFVGAGA